MVHRKDRRVSFLANPQSMRANFLLAEEPEESLRAIFAFLAGSGLRWREMVFNYIPEDSAAARLGQAACREARLRVGFQPSLISPYIPLAGLDWDTYLAQRTSRLRKSLRTHERRLLQREAARWLLYRDPACVEQALQACREVSLATWQHERSASIASTPQLWDFYRRLAGVAAQRGWLRIGILEARGKAAAFDYALVFRQVYFNVKIGYRPELRDCAPGNSLKTFMIRQAMAEGLLEFDLMGMNDPYKADWASSVRRHTCLCVAGRGLRAGARHWVEFGAKPRLRQWPAAVAMKRWLDARRSRGEAARAGAAESA
jgi:CelD/BcsL family acetyltransferase involved in cellulose biosynthesis